MERKILLRTSRKQKTKAKIQNIHSLKVQKKNRMSGRGNIMQEAYLKKPYYLLKKKKYKCRGFTSKMLQTTYITCNLVFFSSPSGLMT
jgi:hypothetical protein